MALLLGTYKSIKTFGSLTEKQFLNGQGEEKKEHLNHRF